MELHLGDNCIQKFVFGEVYSQIYIRKCSFTATPKLSCKTSLPDRISDDIPSQMKILMVIPIICNAFLQFCLKLECCKPQKATGHLTNCDAINDLQLFPAVYRRKYCHKFLTLSNQTPHYKSMCIRITV